MKTIDWEKLRKAALAAKDNAYAPYSGFKVGAAILAGGNVYTGCNVENAAYPVGLCAERGALAAAVTAGARDLQALVIIAEKPVTPCGMCRQAMAEFNPEVPVVMISEQVESQSTLDRLLPNPFGL